MAYEVQMQANTDLSVDEIYEVLSKGIDIQRNEYYPATIMGDGFYCYVSCFEAGAEYSDYLENPVTLDVTFRYHPAANGNGELMAFVSNWLRYTDADTVLEHNYEYITLLRVDGKLIKNVNPRVVKYSGSIELGDIQYKEANLGLFLPWDDIYVESLHGITQIMASFCQFLFDDRETKIDERLTGTPPRKTWAHVERDAFEIRAHQYDPLRWAEKWKRDGAKYPFLANCHVDLHYRRGRGILQKRNAVHVVPARDDTLKAVAELIRTTDDNLLLEFNEPKRDVLMYHASELTLYEDSCWTEERLRLFEGIPYKFSAPIP